MNDKEFYNNILKAFNIINEKSKETKSNYMIVSSEVAEAIKMLDIKYQRKKKLEKIKKLSDK